MAAIAVAILFQTLETKSAWGDLDTSFGFQGGAFDNVTGHYPRSVALQTDGKILVTGYRVSPLGGTNFFLRRYLSNGQLDTSFGTNGAATGPQTPFRGSDYRGDAIVVQPNGKIAVSGWANGYYAVWQFNSNGKADKTFAVNGLQILQNFPVIASAYPEINIHSANILLSLRKEVGNYFRVVLIKLTPSGAVDPAFGQSGESLTDIAGGVGSRFGTVVETDGKITIGGGFYDVIGQGLERKLANGQDDPTFSPPPAPPREAPFAIARPGLVKTTSGKYIMRWDYLAQTGIGIMLDKFSSSGFFESTLMLYDQVPTGGCPEVFTNQNDGKLIGQSTGLLIRTNAEIDYSSREIHDCSNLYGVTSLARAAIQPDDKMVVAGVYGNYLMLARLLPD